VPVVKACAFSKKSMVLSLNDLTVEELILNVFDEDCADPNPNGSVLS